MPIPSPLPAAPYDLVESVLNLARVRINDAMASIGGDILTDVQPFTQVMYNAAWRKFQAFLTQLGHSRFKQSVVLLGFPVLANPDPAMQVSLSWSGCFDGTSYYISPALPPDLILPLKIWERVSGMSMAFHHHPMEQALDGLPSCQVAQPFNGCFEWREDTIWMPGASQPLDFKIEYAAFLPDAVTTGTVSWNQQAVPVMRALSPLANYLAAEVAAPRADLDSGTFLQQAEDETRQIYNLEARQKQRTTTSRRGHSSAFLRSARY